LRQGHLQGSGRFYTSKPLKTQALSPYLNHQDVCTVSSSSLRLLWEPSAGDAIAFCRLSRIARRSRIAMTATEPTGHGNQTAMRRSNQHEGCRALLRKPCSCGALSRKGSTSRSAATVLTPLKWDCQEKRQCVFATCSPIAY
jgi:hypothetical protein